jgi:hypothetical protein
MCFIGEFVIAKKAFYNMVIIKEMGYKLNNMEVI